MPRKPCTQHHTQGVQRGEQEPGGPGHRTRNTTHRACTPVNRSQEAQDAVHATPHTERAHRGTGARRPRTPYTQHHTQSVHTGEKEPGGPEHRAHNTTHRACTPVNRSQEAQDTVHATPHTERAHR